MSQDRMVVIDGHIVVQWYEIGKWWTRCKGKSNDESDLAFWQDTPANRQKALSLFGEMPIVCTECKPYEGIHGWYTYTSAIAEAPMSYNVALLKMARSIR